MCESSTRGSRSSHGFGRAGDAESALARQRWEYPARRSFWRSLDAAERGVLAAAAREQVFRAGTALCRQGDTTTDVIMIRSGWTKVTMVSGGREKIISVRGPGDTIGERAALIEVCRSATVVALEDVCALVVSADRFRELLIEHAHMLEVLKMQEYERQNEDLGDGPYGLSEATPLNYSIFYTDIAAFGDPSRNDDDRRVVRDALYAMLQESFRGSNVPWQMCVHEDRGDGVLTAVPPTVSTVSLVDPLIALLAAKLRHHNRRARTPVRIQLRAALHVGPVGLDHIGMSGHSLIHTARLLDAPVLKRSLAAVEADLAFVASDYVYDTVIRHVAGLVDPAAYRQIKVQAKAKESSIAGWMYLAGGNGALSRSLEPRQKAC